MRDSEWRSPFIFRDGRVYDILSLTVQEMVDWKFEDRSYCPLENLLERRKPPKYRWWRSSMEVQERASQQYLEFMLYFSYATSQNKILRETRDWVTEHLATYGQTVPWSRCDKAVVLKTLAGVGWDL